MVTAWIWIWFGSLNSCLDSCQSKKKIIFLLSCKKEVCLETKFVSTNEETNVSKSKFRSFHSNHSTLFVLFLKKLSGLKRLFVDDISDIWSRLQRTISNITRLVPKVAISRGRGSTTEWHFQLEFDWHVWRWGNSSEKNVFFYLPLWEIWN